MKTKQSKIDNLLSYSWSHGYEFFIHYTPPGESPELAAKFYPDLNEVDFMPTYDTLADEINAVVDEIKQECCKINSDKTIKHSLTIQDPFGPGEMEITFHRFENPEAPPQQGREMQVLIDWNQSEIECYKMLRSLSPDPESKKQWTARIAQCRDTILKIQSIQAGVN